VYHVLNRANARLRLFRAAGDYELFPAVLPAAAVSAPRGERAAERRHRWPGRPGGQVGGSGAGARVYSHQRALGRLRWRAWRSK